MQKNQLKTKNPEQALASLMRLCARSERSSGDALRLMRRWGVEESAARGVLAELQKQSFIDDGRFAAAYVREKMRFSGWGAYKIRMGLRGKGISSAEIEHAMSQLTPQTNIQRLDDMLRRKAAKTTCKDIYDLKTKLIRFGVSRGFDYDEVMDSTERFLRESKQA